MPDLAAKVYTTAATSERSAKLREMVDRASSDLLRIAAWPKATLQERPGGPVAGFLMPRLVGCSQIHDLYGVGSRKKTFPKSDWVFLAHAALNCARVFEMVHEQGHIIGDVNPNNVLVTTTAEIRLVDCDSFQIRTRHNRVFRCGVGMPDYMPPELHGSDLHRIDRTEDHDRFGLAVLIFQLLMMGRHPFSGCFSGQGDLPLAQAVRESRYAYSKRAASLLTAPAPNTPRITELSSQIVELFERAFAPPSRTGPTHRPTATEWKAALKNFKSSLKSCIYYFRHYTMKVDACPWCLMAAQIGIDFFPGPMKAVVLPTLDVDKLWAELRILIGAVPKDYIRPQVLGVKFIGRPLPPHPFMTAVTSTSDTGARYIGRPLPSDLPRKLPKAPILLLPTRPSLTIPEPPPKMVAPPLQLKPRPFPELVLPPFPVVPHPKYPSQSVIKPPVLPSRPKLVEPPTPTFQNRSFDIPLILAGCLALFGMFVFSLQKFVGICVLLVAAVRLVYVVLTEEDRTRASQRRHEEVCERLREQAREDFRIRLAEYEDRCEWIRRKHADLEAESLKRHTEECRRLENERRRSWDEECTNLKNKYNRKYSQFIDEYKSECQASRDKHRLLEKSLERDYHERQSRIVDEHRDRYLEDLQSYEADKKRLKLAFDKEEMIWTRQRDKWSAEFNRRENVCTEAQALLKAAEEHERNAVRQLKEFLTRTQDELERAKSEYLATQEDHQAALNSRKSHLSEKRKQEYLEQHLIRHRGPRGVRKNQVKSLEDFGIYSAANVDLLRRYKVADVGPKTIEKLLIWKAHLDRSYRPSNNDLSLQERQEVDAKFAIRLTTLALTLEKGMREIQEAIKRREDERVEAIPRISALVERVAQAEADLQMMDPSGLP